MRKAAYPNCKKNSSADAAARKLLGNTRIKKYIDDRLEEIHNVKNSRCSGSYGISHVCTSRRKHFFGCENLAKPNIAAAISQEMAESSIHPFTEDFENTACLL